MYLCGCVCDYMLVRERERETKRESEHENLDVSELVTRTEVDLFI